MSLERWTSCCWSAATTRITASRSMTPAPTARTESASTSTAAVSSPSSRRRRSCSVAGADEITTSSGRRSICANGWRRDRIWRRANPGRRAGGGWRNSPTSPRARSEGRWRAGARMPRRMPVGRYDSGRSTRAHSSSNSAGGSSSAARNCEARGSRDKGGTARAGFRSRADPDTQPTRRGVAVRRRAATSAPSRPAKAGG